LVIAITTLALLCSAASPATAQGAGCTGDKHRQFDFWLGDWQVTGPDGTVAGTNRIRSIQGGCVLHESWRGASGTTGESFNMYYNRDGLWHQTWVDNSGGRLDLIGGLRDGAMVLEGITPADDGQEVLHRITWSRLDGGRVRQHWQTSRDAGVTWADAFVGIYSKRGGNDG
jgi:hypothetical protein